MLKETCEERHIRELAELLSRRAADVADLPFALLPQARAPRAVQTALAFTTLAEECEARR